MGLFQAKKLRHCKGNHPDSEEADNIMGEKFAHFAVDR